jgi:signal transduction histidine kinase
VSVSLDPTDDGFLVTVEDDGAGFDVDPGAQAGHLGLTSIRERDRARGRVVPHREQVGAGDDGLVLASGRRAADPRGLAAGGRVTPLTSRATNRR